jgi:Mn2+/Fe2+ NRAMP family transporter
MCMNFCGLNPMRALAVAGIVQGSSAPPLLFLIMRTTNDGAVMAERVNGRTINALGWAATGATFAATAGLVAIWFM